VTARARCTPLPAGSACTHRVPLGFGPLRPELPALLARHGKGSSGGFEPPTLAGQLATSRQSSAVGLAADMGPMRPSSSIS